MPRGRASMTGADERGKKRPAAAAAASPGAAAAAAATPPKSKRSKGGCASVGVPLLQKSVAHRAVLRLGAVARLNCRPWVQGHVVVGASVQQVDSHLVAKV